MNVNERNGAGQYYVNTRLDVAKTKSDEDFPEYGPASEVHSLLTNLIEVKAKGFRGVVVTALTGMHLNGNYDPLNNFYGCNPRSIFEGGIWYALQDNGVPCGKSDPLNVAKNVDQLNYDWATGRRPQSAAMAAVDFLRLVVDANKRDRARLVDYFFYRLWKYAESISEYQVASVEDASHSRQFLGHKLVGFTLDYPESGYLPQYLVAQLLASILRTSSINVCGGDESVFGTNTTSKKPADIWFEDDGAVTNLYEVTVKPVNNKRLDDNIDALNVTGHLECPVTYICRMPNDVSAIEVIDGSYFYRGKKFDFVDYYTFCLALFAVIGGDELSVITQNMGDFVKDIHISVEAKAGWNKYMSEL